MVVSLASSTAQAQTTPTEPPFEIREADPLPPDASSIPRPNSGSEPESPADLGGGLQLLLFGLILAFPVVAVLSIRHQIRTSRAASS